MRQIWEKCWEQNTDVQHLLTDFQAAHDTVWSRKIQSEMHKLGSPLPPQKKVNLCRILNNEICANVKIGKHLSSELKLTKV